MTSRAGRVLLTLEGMCQLVGPSIVATDWHSHNCTVVCVKLVTEKVGHAFTPVR